MIALELRFLAGRFHANRWGYAHNEGIPEWPPSPWRILRALVSASYAEDLAPSEVEPLFEQLRTLPRYRLPAAAEAHTRHYMPDTDDANHKRSKVFDAFVAVDGGARDPRPLTMAWDGTLGPAERALLERLCRRIPYVGRAESWAEVRLIDDVSSAPWDCWPDSADTGASSTTLMAVVSDDALAVWGKKEPAPSKGKDVPRSLWDVLTFDVARYIREGWSAVPGTQQARYVFAQPPFRKTSATSRRRERSTAAVTNVARYAIRSSVLPRVEHAIFVGELLRKAAMSCSGKMRVDGVSAPVFSGHGPEASNHRHAMYLATSEHPQNMSRGCIDHLVIAARGGFDRGDVLVLQQLRRLWRKDGHHLELVLVGLGNSTELGGTAAARAPVLATSRVWESVTPFVPTRYPKPARGIDTIPQQISNACEHLLGEAPLEVTPFGDNARWARFRRRRHEGGGRRGPDMAVGARIVFQREVTGPIALGYGAHFGLGLFVPVAG